MAVVQYTAIVNQLRGKLNGSVFNRNKTGYSLQRKQQTAKRSTTVQLRRRANFSFIQRAWKTLTVAQRSACQLSAQNNPTTDRFGQQVVLSGYNHFIKLNLIRLLTNAPLVKNVNTSPAQGFQFEFESAGVLISILPSGAVQIDAGAILVVPSTNAEVLTLIGYVSFPHSRGITNYTGRWLFVGHVTYPVGAVPVPELDVEFPASDPLDYPVDVENSQVLFRIDAWQISRGALLSSQEIIAQIG